ncbi:MAG: hypothetical protein M3R17_15275 [Bacteroidota bacterium]|nr:hypothetical protein [Bacteroidota bacterium]
MAEEINRTCDFCFEKQEDLVNVMCPVCGYPMKGTKEAQTTFRSVNEKVKQKIDEAETALSQARFAMLWPSLTSIVITLAFNLPPKNIYQLAGTLGFYSIFVVLYFIVALKPLQILILASMILLSGILYSLSISVVPKTLLIVPAVILLIYLNCIYSTWRAEKALEGLQSFRQ